ncbi:hypothetical protein FGO68_gene16102 [Halteria grandinella]|uniref:Transmembrane protein n=1 Tax=Halteria grandinella TaxID=5974 RepID=A0A8J8NDK3_HALGN|nr:hypothetical protein FGO68_gene16102 [Halteria grandinella]
MIPGVASGVMNIMLQFIYLDILQTDKWLIPIFDQELDNEGNFIDDQSFTSQFEQQGFQSMYSFKNLGSTLLFCFLIISMYMCYHLFKAFENRVAQFKKATYYLENKLFWCSTIRFIIQQFQPLLISSLINLYSVSKFLNQSFIAQIHFTCDLFKFLVFYFNHYCAYHFSLGNDKSNQTRDNGGNGSVLVPTD